MKYDYIVIGAGLTGALFAHALTKRGYNVLVVEKNKKIGGLCSTSLQHGIMVHDYGPHIFRTDDSDVWSFVNSVCEFQPIVYTPIAIYRGKAYNLPINMNTFAQLYGVTTPHEAYKALLEDIVTSPCPPRSLEDYALAKYGYTVFKTLIEGYTLKRWGTSAQALPPCLLSDIPLRLTYNNSYYEEKHQGVPKLGYTAFIARLLEGSDIAIQSEYDMPFEDFVRNVSKRKGVIYTGRLDELFNYRYGKLEFRSLSYEHIYYGNENNLQGVSVINYTDLDVPYLRSIEHKHFLNQQCKGTMITYEYPSEGGMPMYPVCDDKNLALQRRYRAMADKIPNLICTGRLADFRPYNMAQIVRNVMDWEKELK